MDEIVPDADDGGFLPIARLQTQWRDSRSTKRAERDESDQADRYYHGDQWTADEQAKLNDRNQPIVTFNRIQRKIDGIVGLVERLRQDPKAYPRTPAHQDGAEISTNVLNFVLDQSRWKDTSPEIARDGAIRFAAGVEMEIAPSQDGGDPDIFVHRLDTRNGFFYDPRSRRADFSDARYMGVAKWIDLDLAQDMFPDFADRLKEVATSGASSPGAEDAETNSGAWRNTNERSVFITEHWYTRRGLWRYSFYCGDLELDRGMSQYPGWDHGDKNGPRYRVFSSSIDHDGDRYGFVRNLKGPQDETNHRRSKGMHLLNTFRMTVEGGTMTDEDVVRAREERHRPDGVVVLPPGAEAKFEDNAKQAAQNLEMLTEAKSEIENFGPNPALIGQGIEAKSGRAIALLQQAGIAELGPFLIAYRAFKTQVYRAVWALVQQFWTSERWVRVTDDDGLAQFLSINKLGLDEWGQPTIANKLGHLDVDLIVDEGPDQVNSMADAFDTLVALAQQGAQVPPEIIIELSSLPSSIKKTVLSKLQQAQQPNPLAEQAQQIELAQGAAKVDLTKAQAFKAVADAHKGPTAQPDDPEARAADLGLKRAQTAKTMAEARQRGAQPDLDMFRLDLDHRAEANDTMLELASLEQRHAAAQMRPAEGPYRA